MADRNGEGPVLFAYDGSEQAKDAIRVAARELRDGRGAIVLTVWEPLAALSFAGPAIAGSDIEQSFEAEARQVGDEGAALAASLGFQATALTESGNPIWRTIVDAAEQHDASILVMGSHGRTGVPLVLMGSVAAAVSRHTDRPVLIVHAPSGNGAG
jgi:nucleotide-binding universal stress UspA family protein